MVGPATVRRVATALSLALVLLAAGCSGGERPVLREEAGRAAVTAADGSGDDSGAADETATTVATTVPTTGTTTTVAPSTVTTDPYPPITDEIGPAPAGLGAVFTPSGVLVAVTGATADAYVIETPCGGVTTLAWGQPVGPIQVVIDPGHGGPDEQGAMDVPGLTEAQLNLQVARSTAAVLTERGIAVALTRNGDYRIPISRRAALADAIGPEVFISIHHNTPASRPSPVPGTEVYVQSGSDASRRLGGLLYEEVVATLSGFDIEWTARDDAGVLVVLDDDDEDAYGIARYPTTPAALVEMAYLGNEKEAALLVTPDYREAAADALANGIERYLTTAEEGTGFVDTPRRFNPSGATGGTDGCVDPPLE